MVLDLRSDSMWKIFMSIEYLLNKNIHVIPNELKRPLKLVTMHPRWWNFDGGIGGVAYDGRHR